MIPRIARLAAAYDRIDRRVWEFIIREDHSGWVVRKSGTDEPVKFAAKNLEGALQFIVSATRK